MPTEHLSSAAAAAIASQQQVAAAWEAVKAAKEQAAAARHANEIAERAVMIATVGAIANTALALTPAILAARQVLSDRPRLTTTYLFTSQEAERSRINVHNVGARAVTVQYWELFFSRRRLDNRFREEVIFLAFPEDGLINPVVVEPQGVFQVEFDDWGSERWRKARDGGYDLMVKVHLVGPRKPVSIRVRL